MKSISNLSLVNRRVVIALDDLTLSSIKHIVSIAPQEAQWFHTIEAVSTTPELIQLKLSQKLYIPKQNTSAAQVDSSSSMMIDFYNELKSESLTQDEINETLNSMGCWCHSHHNMAVNPSSQDLKQFNFFVNSSLQQNQNSWQVMLIFNKQDEFYSRVYDPATGIILEGVEVVKTNNYDFSYIDKAAKEKFLQPKLPPLSFFSQKELGKPNSTLSKSLLFGSSVSVASPSQIINEAFALTGPIRLSGTQNTYAFSDEKASLFLDFIEDNIDYQEYIWFLMILTGHKNLIPKCFTSKAFNKNQFDLEAMLEDLILEMNSGFSILDFQTALTHVFELSELHRVKDVTAYIKSVTL